MSSIQVWPPETVRTTGWQACIISRLEFYYLEEKMLEKYGIPENSIHRDYRIVKATRTVDH